jgi:hypothetical protein
VSDQPDTVEIESVFVVHPKGPEPLSVHASREGADEFVLEQGVEDTVEVTELRIED